MPENKHLVQCYNRGCGQSFDPDDNEKDECRHHPGNPVFHDAYKGWSCCNKKSVDFTEFLNIKGCTLSKHSNVKPLEPVKKGLDKELEKKDIIEVRAPVAGPQLQRPPFETPLVLLETQVAESLKQTQLNTEQKPPVSEDGNVAIGTSCKNGGCNTAFEGPQTNESLCTYHPGCPIFHEGLKFWSCCQKRTTDFNTFLNQPGCTTGAHKWVKEIVDGKTIIHFDLWSYDDGEEDLPPGRCNCSVDRRSKCCFLELVNMQVCPENLASEIQSSNAGTVQCRWDWHQTSEHVIVSVYAKKYDPFLSYVKVNPIRLNIKLMFRDQGDAAFELDLELRGVINIKRSSASMLGTKVEIKLKKGEPGSWSKLDFPRTEPKRVPEQSALQTNTMEDDSVDLSSVETITLNKVNIG